MPSLNPAQEEFLRLMQQAGWSDAETARRINVSRAAISQIRTGKNTPETALERLRLAMSKVPASSEMPEKSLPRDKQAEIAELRWRLEYLSRHDGKAYDTISSLINTLYERAKAVNSTPDDVARAALAKGVADVEGHRPVVFGRKRATGAPTGKTSAPKGDDQKH